MHAGVHRDDRAKIRTSSQIIQFLTFTSLLMALAGCGGGGSSSNSGKASGETMSVSPPTISVTATTTQPAPTATVQVNFSGTAKVAEVYVAAQQNGQGISQIINNGGYLPATVYIDFDSPASLGVGTYYGSVQFRGCLDANCTQPVDNSPQTVKVKYTVTKSLFSLTGLNPTSMQAGLADFTLTVTGTDFTPQSTVFWNSNGLTTTYVSNSQLTAQVPAADIATSGAISISVVDPVKGTTPAKVFSIESVPSTITSLSPATAYAGASDFALTVNGSNFTPESMVLWNGTTLATDYVSSSQLIGYVSASNITTTDDNSVSVSDPANGTSNSVTFSVAASPVTITSISPNTVNVGSAEFTLTVNGSGFTSDSGVYWNGTMQTSTYVSATRMTAQIPASETASTGTDAVTVVDKTYGLSNSKNLTVVIPPLALDSISPATVTAGGTSFTLTALGTAFTGTSVIEWNGVALLTTKVSSTELIAQVPAADISSTGTASVLVSDPNSPPGTTSTKTLTIASPSKDAVAYQINPEHNGAVNFSSVSFPSSSTWSVDLGGTPSYAIITSGKVIETVKISTSKSEIVALNQSDGSTAWGPIMLDGVANAAYDNGRVYVINYVPSSSNATLQAFDVDTGSSDWSETYDTYEGDPALLTASDDKVFFALGSYMQAVDGSDGSTLWTQYVDGSTMPVAVTVDGVYTSFYCDAHDLRPATGEYIWAQPLNGGCDGGGGGAIPIVANQRLYAPDSTFNYYEGAVLETGNGTNDGTFTADMPPAFTSTMGYFLQSGTLNGVTLSDNTVQWSFTGDGTLDGAPIAVNQYVIIGSSSGNLYAVDSTTGNQVWNVTLGAAIDTTASLYTLPSTGLAAGDGLLIVPAGTTITAYTLSTSP